MEKYRSRKFLLTAGAVFGFTGVVVFMIFEGLVVSVEGIGLGYTGILAQYGITNVFSEKVAKDE